MVLCADITFSLHKRINILKAQAFVLGYIAHDLYIYMNYFIRALQVKVYIIALLE